MKASKDRRESMRRVLENAKHLLAPLRSNCKEFYARWKAAGVPDDREDMSGRWEGEWISAATGHRGPLRCVMEVLTPERWAGTFRGRYAKVFRACYATDLHTAKLGPDRYTFSGKTDLGWAAGGAYEFDGHGSAAELVFRYRSRMDHGEFRLRRPRTS
ncbi:MAG: hypothetical protein H0X67_05430 [Acidobacteria bacterium]|nr:hypothetical protein [Acidobacteriota bacterium]